MLLQRALEQPAVLLLLDFDGTLSEIVATPEEAVPYPGAVASLREMARKPGYTVGVLSGRSLADVRRRVGINNLCTEATTDWRLPDRASIICTRKLSP